MSHRARGPSQCGGCSFFVDTFLGVAILVPWLDSQRLAHFLSGPIRLLLALMGLVMSTIDSALIAQPGRAHFPCPGSVSGSTSGVSILKGKVQFLAWALYYQSVLHTVRCSGICTEGHNQPTGSSEVERWRNRSCCITRWTRRSIARNYPCGPIVGVRVTLVRVTLPLLMNVSPSVFVIPEIFGFLDGGFGEHLARLLEQQWVAVAQER